ncbi:hypothetical protein ACIA5C_33185 [Actinoplanes sp. NPDC051343]|uniref:hypothetical protein n=1 Tax=Actinoplanes sp. NPDC051343 TaxID=3363906 RepID=UPI003793B9D4
MTRLRWLTAALVMLLLLPAVPAAADSAAPGGDVAVAQTLGDRELTLILRRVTSVPGPLRVEAITHAGTAGGSLTLTLTPASGGTPASSATLALDGAPGSYGATVHVSRAGPWELAVSDGERTARVPFVVTGQAVSPAEKAIYGGFLAAGMFLLVAIVVAVRVRRAGWVLLPGAGLVAGLAVAVTGAVLSASLPLPPQPGLQTDATVGNAEDPYTLSRPLIADYSRPPVLVTVSRRPGDDLSLRLTDASTGLPVDDLVVHDQALIHLLIVGPDGELWHLHPIRVAPGEYRVHFVPPANGHYALSAELERRGGGVQLVRAADGFDADAASPGGPPAYEKISVTAGRRVTTTVSGVPVSVLASGNVAGAAVTLTVGFGTSATLQPWLGMLGHLIVVGPVPAGVPVGPAAQRAPVWAHAHSMGDLTPGMNMPGMSSSGDQSMGGLMPVNGDSAADETVAAYGPSLSFTFTFGSPGRYLLWMQAERDYRILTVPAVLEVTG